jgi:hypothetical protein
MEFRRAIESYCEARQLNQDLCDYLDNATDHLWQVAMPPEDGRRNVRQAG